jgi:hypothetical protein
VARLQGELVEARRATETARGELERVRVQKDAQIRGLKGILARINGLLEQNGLPQIPEDLGEEATTAAINALGTRLAQPPAPVPAPDADRNQMICLLNILYNLLKRTFLQIGDLRDLDFREAFQSLEQAAQQDSQRPANQQKLGQNLIDYFLLLPKMLENTASQEETRNFGAKAGELLQYYRVDQATSLTGRVDALGTAMFDQFFPEVDRDLKTFETLPFLLLFAFTKKILVKHEAEIEAIGCRIPQAIVQPPPPPPEPVGPGVRRCAEKTPVDVATRATPPDNRIRLTTVRSEKLQRFPFCLDVLGWVDYVKSDLEAKASANFLAAFPAAGAEREERIRELQSTSLRINPQSGAVKLVGGGAGHGPKTRKQRGQGSKKTKTYKVSK